MFFIILFRGKKIKKGAFFKGEGGMKALKPQKKRELLMITHKKIKMRSLVKGGRAKRHKRGCSKKKGGG